MPSVLLVVLLTFLTQNVFPPFSIGPKDFKHSKEQDLRDIFFRGLRPLAWQHHKAAMLHDYRYCPPLQLAAPANKKLTYSFPQCFSEPRYVLHVFLILLGKTLHGPSLLALCFCTAQSSNELNPRFTARNTFLDPFTFPRVRSPVQNNG